jgi:hypothetical protein
MARRVRGLFENQKLTYFGASGVSERAYQKNLRSSRVCGTFLFFFGNYTCREVHLLVAADIRSHRATAKPWNSCFYFWEFASWQNPAFTQGGVFSNFCPESEPICLATRNNQSRFSALPSVGGTSDVEDGVRARLKGCTEWLADATSRPLPTHPHMHSVVD